MADPQGYRERGRGDQERRDRGGQGQGGVSRDQDQKVSIGRSRVMEAITQISVDDKGRLTKNAVAPKVQEWLNELTPQDREILFQNFSGTEVPVIKDTLSVIIKGEDENQRRQRAEDLNLLSVSSQANEVWTDILCKLQNEDLDDFRRFTGWFAILQPYEAQIFRNNVSSQGADKGFQVVKIIVEFQGDDDAKTALTRNLGLIPEVQQPPPAPANP